MKFILRYIIKSIINLIEKIEYRKADLNEDDVSKKIINIIFPENLKVDTDYGFVPVEEINQTQPYTEYKIKLENGLTWEGADNHIFFNHNHEQIQSKELTTNDILMTKQGPSKVKSIKKTNHKLSMFDLNIGTNEHSYFTNDILSHNTISAAIVILHFVLFNNDKSVMIVANKGKTVKEIVKKVKDIYKLVPFFLKKGIVNWNETSIAFDNGSRILSENRTKEPSIGFAIDFLYLDEFAKVPDNIIREYYGSVVPTVSSIENSKIIITSTPDGFNLFHELLMGAEKEPDDPLKNEYEAMRVYWHQVEGRRDTKYMPLAYRMKQYDITLEEINDFLIAEYGFEITEQKRNNKRWQHIKFDPNDDFTKISEVRKIRIKKVYDDIEKEIPLSELCVITNWKEQETKLVGGETMFSREYDLNFVTDDKLLFDSEELDNMKRDTTKFEYIDFPLLSQKISLPYNQLKWLSGMPELFCRSKMKDYHIVASIDLGEGLGEDYSVLNIFRLMPKPRDLIEKTHEKLNNIYEYFYLEQIGVFRTNNWASNEFAELFYLVMFELFDPDKCKVVLEYNTYGSTLLSDLVSVFDGETNFSNGIFLRYKHRKDDKKMKIGMKITSGERDAAKKMLVKAFQSAVHKRLIKLHYDTNVNEISTFVKKKTPSGDFTYKCEGGNDDLVMTNVTLSSVFEHTQYKNLIEDLLNKIPASIKNMIEEFAYKNKSNEQVNYETTKKAYNNVYKNRRRKQIYTYPWNN